MMKSTQNEMKVSNLIEGVYFVKIKNKSGKEFLSKFIKQ